MSDFAPVPDLLAALAQGRMIVLCDDEDRENEGDLVMAAQFADPKAIAFMATKACGLICLAMDGVLLDRLGLPLMTSDNRSRLGTAFTLSIEAREGVTTGISAADRARTIQVAIAEHSRPQDIVTPGHIFPLRARDGGVLVRAGHTEAAVDLCRLAGLKPAGVICEIMQADGTMARVPQLITYATEHGLPIGSIADLIAWREARERLVELVAEGEVATAAGPFRACVYRSSVTGDHHLALVRGRPRPGGDCADPVLVRVQKESPLADAFAAPGRLPAVAVLRQIAAAGEGVFLLMRDGDGRALADEVAALAGGMRPQPAMDHRDYGIGAQILRHLGVRRMRLVTGSDRPISALSGHGIELVERVRPG
jgi:3,4-dihydroxy 2-butanone 4-phosphate synthase/GTP cyclohydrolase II